MIRLALRRLHDYLSQRTGRLRAVFFGWPVCLVLLMGACGTAPRPTSDPSSEEMEDFRQVMQQNTAKLDEYLLKTKKGNNISELTLGWFTYDILTELSSQDDGLYDYFNKDNGNIQVYLKTEFKDQPLDEIAKLETLAAQGHPTLRLAARYALETLRHIPDSSEAADIQERDRRDLAAAMLTLQGLLQKCAKEATVSPP
jgi:hypothetical protein